MTLDEHRTIIADYLDTVTIHRATPGLRGFDPNRVTITWREIGQH